MADAQRGLRSPTGTRAPNESVATWQVAMLAEQCLGVHATAWDQLAGRLEGGHPVLCSTFINTLLRHAGSGREYLCRGLNGAGELVAANLLQRVGTGVWRSFVPPPSQIAPVLMRDASALSSLLRALPGWALRLDLTNVDDRYGRLATTRPYRPGSKWHALTTGIQLTGGHQAYLDSRTAEFQSKLHFQARCMAAHGEVAYRVLTEPGDMVAAMQRHAALQVAGWNSSKGTGEHIGTIGLYNTLMDDGARHGHAEVHELWIGNTLVASQLALVSSAVVVMLRNANLEAWAEEAPDELLLAHSIERAFETHLGKRLEFYASVTSDQHQWATVTQPLRHFSHYRFSALAELDGPLSAMQAAPWRQIRRHNSTAQPAAVARCYPSVADLPEPVQAFMQNASGGSPTATADWYANLCEHVPELGQRARFHVLATENHVLAVLPLASGSSTGRLAPRTLEGLSNYYTALYAPVFAQRLTARDLVPLLRAALCGPQRAAARLMLSPMDPDSREYSLLREALTLMGWPTFPFFNFGNWYLRAPANWDDYLASRSASFRSNLKRSTKRFESEGGALEIVRDELRLPIALQAYETVYASSWKVPEPYPAFVRGLAQSACRRGGLRMGLAWLNDRPIAAQLWLTTKESVQIYKVAYDEAYKHLAPGAVLTAHLLRRSIETDGVREVDFLIGDDEYKAKWMSDRRERWGLVAYNPTSWAGAVGLIKETSGRLIKAFR